MSKKHWSTVFEILKRVGKKYDDWKVIHDFYKRTICVFKTFIILENEERRGLDAFEMWS